MPTITSTDILAIVKLAIYAPLFPLSAFLLFRHGFAKDAGWLQLSIFCLIRLLGSTAQIATIQDKSNVTLYIMADVLLVIGLAPLLVATLGFVSRAIKSMLATPSAIKIFTLITRAVGLVSLVALILCIVGSTNVRSLNQLVSDQPLVTAGKIIYAIVYLAVVIITLFAIALYYYTRPSRAQSGGEGALISAVVVALPLILVRLIYAHLGTWTDDKARYGAFTGSLALQIALSVWEEIIVSIVFIVVGFVVPRMPKNGSGAGAGAGTEGVGSKADGSLMLQHWYDNKAIRYTSIVGLVARVAESLSK